MLQHRSNLRCWPSDHTTTTSNQPERMYCAMPVTLCLAALVAGFATALQVSRRVHFYKGAKLVQSGVLKLGEISRGWGRQGAD